MFSLLYGVFPDNLGHSISLAYLRKKPRSNHVTREALAARNNVRPTDKATAQSRSVQSFAIIKNTGHENFSTLELQMDYPSETGMCTAAPSPTDTPSPIFFSEGRGWLYTGYLKWIIYLQTVRQN